MFEKILVCLDGSELAEQILPYVTAQAAALNSTLILLHVVHEPTAMGINLPGMPALPIETRGLLKHFAIHSGEAHDYLKSVADKIALQHIKVESVVLTGRVGEIIVEYAAQNDIGVVAIATHGRGGLGRAIFGSVAEYVLHNCTVPILSIRPQVISPDKQKAIA